MAPFFEDGLRIAPRRWELPATRWLTNSPPRSARRVFHFDTSFEQLVTNRISVAEVSTGTRVFPLLDQKAYEPIQPTR